MLLINDTFYLDSYLRNSKQLDSTPLLFKITSIYELHPQSILSCV